MRIQAPNYTQSPNVLFDEIFKTLREGELRIVLVLVRQTFGWHKQWDQISIGMLAEKTGMERRSIFRSLSSLMEKGLVERKKFGKNGKEKCYFSLVLQEPEKEECEYDDEISEEEMEMLSTNYYGPNESRNQEIKKTYTGDRKVPGPVTQKIYTSDLSPPTKETITKEKKQQQAAPAAAVFSASKKKQEKQLSEKTGELKPVVYQCLLGVIPLTDQTQITETYDENTVKSAVAWATHPQTVITKSLAAAIKWACQNNPQVPQNKEEVESENRKYAAKYDGMKNKGAQIMACNKYVEIIHIGTANNSGHFIDYDTKGFMEKFKEALKVNKFKVLE